MKQWLTALVLFSAANAASAAVINFDDLTGDGPLPGNYQRFTWTGWTYYDTAQTPFTPASGATRIFADQSNSISSATDFIFNGSYLSGFEPDTIEYELYKDGALVHTSSIFSSLSEAPTYFASGYNGLVDKVVYKFTNGFFSVDNFTYNASTVPEPESFAMLMIGIGLIGFIQRRRFLN